MKEILARIDGRTAAIWAVVAVVLGVAWLLYPRYRSEAAAEGIIEITYWAPLPAEQYDSMKPAIEEFEKRNPQYRVRMGAATARDAVGDPTRFLLGVAGGDPPDVIYFDRFAIVEWASRGAFANLSPYVEADRDNPDGIHEDDFFEVAWREPIYEGKLYAVPEDVDTRALFYAHDPLIRAGFTFGPDDPEVVAGKARVGDARPPRSWEEICRKLIHAEGRAEADGTVTLTGFARRMAVNEDVPEGAAVDLAAAGVRPGDVVALVSGSEVFRARVGSVSGPASFRVDFMRDQPSGRDSVPAGVRGECEVKVFDQDSYVSRLTRFDQRTGRMTAVGFIPMFGNSWLYMFGWLNGGEFMTPDGKECTLDSPEIVEALQWVTDVYDSIGGYQTARVFVDGAATQTMDPFLTGDLAMRIDNNYFIRTINAFKPDWEFGVIPAPIPEDRLAAGETSVGWGGGWAFAIPATARHRDAGWELIRWLSCPEGVKLINEFRANYNRSQGQPYFPGLHANRRAMEWLTATYIEGRGDLSEDVTEAFGQFVELLPNSKYRPVTPVGQKLWSEHRRAAEAAMDHAKPSYEALNYGKRRVQQALDQYFNPPTGPLVNWRALITAYVIGVAALFIGLAVWQEVRLRRAGHRERGWFEGYIAASPWLLGFIVFGAGPILFSLVISFCHYDVLNPARFVGLENYSRLIGRHYDGVVGETVWNDPIFWKSLGNTLFMVVAVPLTIVAGLGIALLLNTRVRGLQVYRTIYYLPAIVPAVASFILWIWVFDPGRGMLNQALIALGASNPPNWLQDPSWAKPSLIIMGLWGVGAAMIIWLAGLKDIPEVMYEASAIDGAGRIQQFFFVTLPLLSPYIFFNVVMGLIATFQIFEAAYIMTEGGPSDATLFYAYKLFNEAFRYLNMGAASAMAWLLFIVVLAITLFQLWLGRKWVHYGG